MRCPECGETDHEDCTPHRARSFAAVAAVKPRVLSEARHVARAAGRFAAMNKCQVCEKPGTLEPAFGGDDADPRAATDLAWGKLICPRCARAAARRLARPETAP